MTVGSGLRSDPSQGHIAPSGTLGAMGTPAIGPANGAANGPANGIAFDCAVAVPLETEATTRLIAVKNLQNRRKIESVMHTFDGQTLVLPR
jgi:hypothetical protein